MNRLCAIIILALLLPAMAAICLCLSLAYPFFVFSDWRHHRRERREWETARVRGTAVLWGGEVLGVN